MSPKFLPVVLAARTPSGEAAETEKISKRDLPAPGACWGSGSDLDTILIVTVTI